MHEVFRLWDRLADFPASEMDAALTHLMEALAGWFQAQDIVWVGAARVRTGRQALKDVQQGWRGVAIRHYRPTPEILERSRYAAKAQETSPDLTTRALIAGNGKLRVHRLHDGFVDLRAMKKTESYRVIYQEAGIADRMFVGVPIHADAESFLLLDRYGPARRFTAAEAERVELTMRGLKWLHRELMLSHGLLLAQAPLTPMERKVLQALLTDRTEKEIAHGLGQSPKTTHKTVTQIAQKFGVSGRLGLMALWLGRRS